LALLHIGQNDGKPTAEVLAAPLIGAKPTVEELRVDGRTVAFAFKIGPTVLKVSLTAPEGVEKPECLPGVIEVNGQTIPAELERTEGKEITQAEARMAGPAGQSLNKARGLRDTSERIDALKAILKKHPNTGAALAAAQLVLQERAKEGAGDEELRAAAQE